jgi:hypothetical protein
MLKMRGEDFGSNDAVYALQNYILFVRHDLLRLQKVYALFIFVLIVTFFVWFFRTGVGFYEILALIYISTIIAVLIILNSLELYKTNKIIKILQEELHNRGLY